MAINIDRKKIQQLSRLEFLAKQAVEGFITGMHKSPFHGFSVEFAEHRIYNKGEPTRHIDWKLFARSEKLFVKRYEEETNLRCHLVLDHSASMFFPGEVDPGSDEFNKIKFSVYGAAALIELFKRQRDAVGLSVFGDGLELHTPCRSSNAHHSYLYSELERLLDKVDSPPSKKTFAIDALHEIAESVHRRSLVIIFSDMMDNSDQQDELFSALQHLKHNKHEVIIFHTADPDTELEFNYPNRPHTFVDKETGEEIKVNPVDIRDQYVSQMKTFRSDLKLKSGQYGIDFIEANINEGVNQVLLEYMIKRQKLY